MAPWMRHYYNSVCILRETPHHKISWCNSVDSPLVNVSFQPSLYLRTPADISRNTPPCSLSDSFKHTVNEEVTFPWLNFTGAIGVHLTLDWTSWDVIVYGQLMTHHHANSFRLVQLISVIVRLNVCLWFLSDVCLWLQHFLMRSCKPGPPADTAAVISQGYFSKWRREWCRRPKWIGTLSTHRVWSPGMDRLA